MRDRLLNYIVVAGLLALVPALIVTGGGSTFSVFLGTAISLIVVGFLSEVIQHIPEEEIEFPEDGQDPKEPRNLASTVLSGMPFPLVLINESGRIAYANAAALEAIHLLTINNHYTNVFRSPQLIETINDVFATGKRKTLVYQSSNNITYEVQAALLNLSDGSGRNVILKIDDKTEERLIRLIRSDFIANASHELKTPLASIMGYIETLEEAAKDDPEAQQRFLKIMAKQGQRMQRLLDDLMSLSRIERNVHKRPEVVCDVNAVLRDTIDSLKPVLEAEDIMLTLSPAMYTVHTKGDKDQLQQVFGNLIENAVKYGGNGKSIEIDLIEDDERYPKMFGISVKDQGVGIASTGINRLTERFYRVNSTLSKQKGGTGLGLSIVKHILNRHRGDLTIDSVINEGSNFTIWLPKLS